MSTPGDESRTELAWREIVEHYGDRPVLDDDTRPVASPVAPAVGRDAAEDDEHDDGDDEVEAVAAVDRFEPPAPPPFPTPRTWQRGVAWAGIFLAPALALVIGLLSIYVAPLVGWALVAWFVGGFGYLVFVMPRAPRDPWDDGSRI
ncbi:hypothetical protein EUA06_02075 [Nocardioides glacieisoli]|uniref:Uncharacterized protein n=1 Tax=Nocardioides glacieisoli TaxID=1168730 RepID=A0A4Q2S7D2_9ACTN|nr:hypothetical protein [Nocardioides glacieisoli]RYB96385.1 hypothetical protein EUA06_02075 [Nocardioides glacieisoli]